MLKQCSAVKGSFFVRLADLLCAIVHCAAGRQTLAMGDKNRHLASRHW